MYTIRLLPVSNANRSTSVQGTCHSQSMPSPEKRRPAPQSLQTGFARCRAACLAAQLGLLLALVLAATSFAFAQQPADAQAPSQQPAPPAVNSPPPAQDQNHPNAQGQSQQPAPQTETPTVTVSGAAHTADGAPVPGAAIRLVNTDTQKAWVTWTDESGKFEFPALPAGHYTATATQLGFGLSSIDVQVQSTAPAPVNLVLRVVSVADLNGQPPSTRPRGPGMRPGAPGAGNAANNQGQGAPGGFGRGQGGGRGQIPAGLQNALSQGMANGGFQQTDVTGENGQIEATSIPGGEAAGAPVGGGSTSDSFLLQGTVGQGLSFNMPGGPPGGFENSMGGPPEAAGGAQTAGFGPGGGGAGPGGGGGGFPGGGPGGGGPPGGFPGGPGGRGALFRNGGAGGRLFRQAANRVRFTFYNYYSNSAFDAKPFSITGAPETKLGTYDERFGGNMGGPLKIPHIYDGSDKTYFFVNFQHETSLNPTNNYSIVPTPDERNGCFTAGTVFQPFTTTPFTSQGSCAAGEVQVPINPIAQQLLTYIPLPNQATSTGVGQNYLLQAKPTHNTDTLNTTVLHTINSKFNVNGSYHLQSQRYDTIGNFPSTGGTSSTLSQSATLGLSHNWSSHVVESTTLTWSRSRVQVLSDNAYDDALSPESLGIDLNVPSSAILPVNYGLPQISFTNFSGFNDPFPSLVRNETFRLDDGITWVYKNHSIRFGGEVRRVELNTDSDPNPRGGFTFTGIATGSDFADFLVDCEPGVCPINTGTTPLYGFPFNTTEQIAENPSTYLRSWGFALYAQDDWRVTKTFTFQYGLRYDSVTPPYELNNSLVNLDMNPEITALAASGATCTSCVEIVQPGGTGSFSGVYPRSLIHGKYDNFEPRIGIAWQPKFIKPKTVIRSGYSIFYNVNIYTTLAKELLYQYPTTTSENLTTSTTQLLTLSDPFSASSGISIPNTEAVDPFYKPGYAQIWNFGTETSFSQNWILDLTYTGTKGTDLDVLRAPNRAPLGTAEDEIQQSRVDPEATGFTYDQSGANSIYNALQVRVMHRFTKGFMLQGIYTFGKSLDDASSIGGTAATVEQQDGNLRAEYGLSTFDIRHQLRVNSVWELPFGQRARFFNHGWTEKVFGDWRLQNTVTWQTGSPFTVLLGGVASDNGTGTNFSLRPNMTGDPNLGVCGGNQETFFDTSVFSPPVDSAGNLTYGNERRGAVEGPCQFTWNSSIAKTFRFGPERRHNMNIAWQITNLTNTPTFTGLGTVIPCTESPESPGGLLCQTGSGTTSSTTRSFFGHITSAGAMRTMGLMVRFNL